MTAVAWPIVLPLAGAVAALLAGRRLVAPIGLATSAATLAAGVHAAAAVWREGPIRYPLGGWHAPLGIDLAADGLSAVMLLMAAAVGAGISLFAAGHFTGPPQATSARAFWPLWLFLWGALNAVFLSADVFNLYVALELLTLSSVGLVVLARGRDALTAAARYLLAALLAALVYLFGVGILYGEFGALDMATLEARVEPGWAAGAALALMTGGLLMKTALVPLHFWLPRAHASAVTPASAILSALVIKASFYIALRLWGDVFSAVITTGAAQLLGGLGAVAVIWGGFQASRQHEIKLLVGYSTVSQIGYLFLLFPLAFGLDGAAPWRAAALSGGIVHAVAHAFAKSAMFLAVGLMVAASGQSRVEGMLGVGKRLPLAVFAFGLAGLSIVGLPPSGGFVAKWLLLGAAVEAGQWWWAIVLLAGGLLSAGYVFLVLGYTLTPAPETAAPDGPIRHQRLLEHTCLWLALVGFALGFRSTDVLELLAGGAP
jgi:multicomponent Na+:H+ antiporter subunit D